MIAHMNRRTFLLLAPVALVRGAETGSVTAETTSGKVRGIEVDGIKIFKGIPYGASTAGKNRFMPPVSPRKMDRRARCAAIRAERARRSRRTLNWPEGRLPGPQRLDARDQRWTQAPGDVLVPRRRLRHRLRLLARTRRHQPRASRRCGGGDDQPPPERARLHLPRRGFGGERLRTVGQRRHARHRAGAASGCATTSSSSAATRTRS